MQESCSAVHVHTTKLSPIGATAWGHILHRLTLTSKPAKLPRTPTHTSHLLLTNQFVCFVHISLGHLFEFVLSIFTVTLKCFWNNLNESYSRKNPIFCCFWCSLEPGNISAKSSCRRKGADRHMLPIIRHIHRCTHTSKHTHHTLASVCVCVTSPKHLLAARSSTEWFSKERNVCMCLFALERLSLWRPVKSWISFALRRSFKELLNDSDLVMCFKLEPDAGLGKPLIYDGWSLCLGSENALCHYRFSHLKQYVWVKVLLDVSYSENHFLLDISITEKMLNYWGRVCFLQD